MQLSAHMHLALSCLIPQQVTDGCGQLAAAVRSRRRQVLCTAVVCSNSTTIPSFDTDPRQTKRRGRPPKDRNSHWQQDSLLTDSQHEVAKLPVSSNGHNARSNVHSNGANKRRSRRLFPAVQQQPQHTDGPTTQPGDSSSADPGHHNTERIAEAAAQHQTETAEADEAGAAAVARGAVAPSTASGQMPPERVWREELRPFSALMSNPNKPWVQPFILKHCYIVNTPEAREKFVALTPAEMHKVMKWRLQVEMRLVKLAHSLAAAWRRLQLLSAAVGDQGQVLTTEQLNKEREQIVAMLDSVKEGQKFLVRAVTTATELHDHRYLTKAGTYRQLLATMMATTDSYLREYLRRIGTASKINSRIQQNWQETPEPLREPLHVVEGRRQQQLLGLQSLCPEHPTQQLADYRALAIKFEVYQDKQLKQRKPTTGQPSSTGGSFWQQRSTEGTLPIATPTAAAAATADLGPVAAAVPTNKQQRKALKASWEQNPEQLMARPLQQLPLLPHLGKHRHWLPQLERQQQQVSQREVALQLQLQVEEQQQQELQGQVRDLSDEQQQQHIAADQELQQQQRREQMRAARLDPDSLQRPSFPAAISAYPLQDLGSLHLATAGIGDQGPTIADPDQIRLPTVAGPMFSYSGKVIPPMPVLLQRALQLEERLIAEEDRKREMFAANNAYVKSQRERQW